MSRTYEYRSGLASQISAFIAEKRACGCKYEKEAKTFQTLDRFLVEQGINTPVLPELVVEKWIEKRPNEKRKNQKWRLNFTKRFAKYLQLNGYAAYYPELTISSRDDADFSPCIFTSDELARMKKLSREGKLNDDTMLDIMMEQKKPEGYNVVLSADKLRKYFPRSYTPQKMEETILKLLDAWLRKRQRDQSR